MASVDPFEWFTRWYHEAVAAEPRVPDAMQIATIDDRGRPHVRTVLLKSKGSDGLVFYTNLRSAKARQLLADPRVAAVFHWKSLERQVHVEGIARPVAHAEADAYFATRDRGSQLGAWASDQSAPLADRRTLEVRMAEVTAQFADRPVPRPPHWSGFRIVPHRFEFWQGRADRLHDRIQLTRGAVGWTQSLLQP